MLVLQEDFGIIAIISRACKASRESRSSLMGKFSEEVVAELHSVTETVQCQRARSDRNNMRVSLTIGQRHRFHKAMILHFNDADLMVHIVSADA